MKANLNDISAKEKSAEKQEFAGYVGKRLRKIRTEKGISQELLSEKASYYRTYVGHIENGQHSRKWTRTISILAHQFTLDIIYL